MGLGQLFSSRVMETVLPMVTAQKNSAARSGKICPTTLLKAGGLGLETTRGGKNQTADLTALLPQEVPSLAESTKEVQALAEAIRTGKPLLDYRRPVLGGGADR